MKPLPSFQNMVDPENLVIETGVYVRDITTLGECAQALAILDAKKTSIVAQIAESEEDPAFRPKGWRSRAAVALSYTKRARAAVIAKRTILEARGRAPKVKRQAALLDVIRDQLGVDHFEDLVALAKVKHPDLFQEAEL